MAREGRGGSRSAGGTIRPAAAPVCGEGPAGPLSTWYASRGVRRARLGAFRRGRPRAALGDADQGWGLIQPYEALTASPDQRRPGPTAPNQKDAGTQASAATPVRPMSASTDPLDPVREQALWWTGDPYPDVAHTFGRLRDAGHQLHLVTARDVAGAEAGMAATRHWLGANGLEVDSVNLAQDKPRVLAELQLEPDTCIAVDDGRG